MHVYMPSASTFIYSHKAWPSSKRIRQATSPLPYLSPSRIFHYMQYTSLVEQNVTCHYMQQLGHNTCCIPLLQIHQPEHEITWVGLHNT